jgi:hypothetical protein
VTRSNLPLSLFRDGYSPDALIRQDAGSVSPSPRFAESAQQNGERAGVRCFVLILLKMFIAMDIELVRARFIAEQDALARDNFADAG